MGFAELIEKLRTLPEDKRAEVFDFVEFLAGRSEASVVDGKSAFGVGHALRGIEDDPVTYDQDDLRERWR